jgi:CheY-like chemotaxis protein
LATTLLAVDDSKTMRKVIEITFAGEDFKLVVCGSADEAMSKLSERPSVALVDAGLDGTTGYELCRRLKAAQPGIGVVILSNKQQPYDRNLGGQVGADDFADKPFDTQQLIDKVVQVAKKVGASAGTPGPGPVAPAAQPAAQPAPRAAATTLQYGASPVAIPPAPGQAPAHAAGPAAGAPRPTAPGLAAHVPQVSRAPAPTLMAAGNPPAAAPAPAAAAPQPAPAVAAALSGANGADFAKKLGSLGLTSDQVNGVVARWRGGSGGGGWVGVP